MPQSSYGSSARSTSRCAHRRRPGALCHESVPGRAQRASQLRPALQNVEHSIAEILGFELRAKQPFGF